MFDLDKVFPHAVNDPHQEARRADACWRTRGGSAAIPAPASRRRGAIGRDDELAILHGRMFDEVRSRLRMLATGAGRNRQTDCAQLVSRCESGSASALRSHRRTAPTWIACSRGDIAPLSNERPPGRNGISNSSTPQQTQRGERVGGLCHGRGELIRLTPAKNAKRLSDLIGEGHSRNTLDHLSRAD